MNKKSFNYDDFFNILKIKMLNSDLSIYEEEKIQLVNFIDNFYEKNHKLIDFSFNNKDILLSIFYDNNGLFFNFMPTDENLHNYFFYSQKNKLLNTLLNHLDFNHSFDNYQNFFISINLKNYSKIKEKILLNHFLSLNNNTKIINKI